MAQSYSQRSASLKAMGFATYRDYLASKLWARIRRKVFAKRGKKCVCCGKLATSIHHASYSLPTMRGERIDALLPICCDCHQSIEFDEAGKKVSVKVANRRLQQAMPSQPVEQVTPKACAFCGTNTAEKGSMCRACRTLWRQRKPSLKPSRQIVEQCASEVWWLRFRRKAKFTLNFYDARCNEFVGTYSPFRETLRIHGDVPRAIRPEEVVDVLASAINAIDRHFDEW